ncbi:MAG: VanZ family protein [Planctomycetes bacterium]|nr:VanZ family protein [Planctomycetota bacterium]
MGLPAGPLVVFVFNGGHFVLFGVLAALAALALSARSRARRLTAIGLAVAWGVLDELHQRSVPGRDCSVFDIATDACGAWFAVAALSLLRGASGGARRAMFAAAALGLGAIVAGTFL